MLKKSLILFIAILAVASLPAQDITVDEILANYLENIGGKENWKALEATKMQAKMTMGQMEFPATVTNVPPNKMRIDVDVQGSQMIQAYDGETAWWLFPMQTGDQPQKMPAAMAESFKKQKFESSFIDYKDKGHTVELTGVKEVEGTETYEVKLTKKDGDIEYHYFDTEYFVPIMTKTFVQQGQAEGQAVETYMSDYQEVEGLMFAHFMEVKVAGQSQQKITMESITLNPEVEKGLFDFPGEGEESAGEEEDKPEKGN